MDDPRYAPLRRVLDSAYDQCASGKGADRHADGRAFIEQPIMEIGRLVGPGFALGQALKKVQEAATMVRRQKVPNAQFELLGAIVYLSAAYLLLDENMEPYNARDA